MDSNIDSAIAAYNVERRKRDGEEQPGWSDMVASTAFRAGAAWQAARRTLPQGYAAGIEAAAKYHEDAVDKIRSSAKLSGGYSSAQLTAIVDHDEHAAAIRSLPSPDAGVVEKKP